MPRNENDILKNNSKRDVGEGGTKKFRCRPPLISVHAICRYAIFVAALTACASAAVHMPNTVPAASAPKSAANAGDSMQEPIAQGTNVIAHKHRQPEKIVYVSHGVQAHKNSGLLEAGLYSVLEFASIPKKLVGVIVGYVAGKLKTINFKGLLKYALIGAVITVLGAVAAVAVAGLVSIASCIYALLPYAKLLLGLGGGKHSGISESHLDNMSEFVLGAFDKYDQQQHYKA